jgi:predicted transcriptional regulator
MSQNLQPTALRMLIDFRKEVPIDYNEVAQQVKRSRSTVRKWRSKIEEVSGHKFKSARISRSLYGYDFNKAEVKQFIQLAQSLEAGNTLKTAITQSFGNKQLEAFKEKNNRIKKLEREVQKQQINQELLQEQLYTLTQESEQLRHRLETLENKKWFKPRQK